MEHVRDTATGVGHAARPTQQRGQTLCGKVITLSPHWMTEHVQVTCPDCQRLARGK